MASLYGGIKLISEISRTQGMVAELISQQDFLGALDLVEGLVSLIRAGNNLILQQPGGGSSAAGTSSGGGAAGSLANGSALDDTKVVGGGGGGSNSGGGGLLVGSEAYAQLTSMGIMLEEMSARVKLLRVK